MVVWAPADEANSRGHVGPAPWLACLGVPSGESLVGQGMCFQIILFLLLSPPMHQHPPAYSPSAYPPLGRGWGNKTQLREGETGANIYWVPTMSQTLY